jgi:hypothetical protein
MLRPYLDEGIGLIEGGGVAVSSLGIEDGPNCRGRFKE